MKNSLPTGWEITRIADVFAVNPGHTGIVIADDDEVSFVPMPEIEQETGKLNATTSRAYREIKKGYTKFVEGDVLFAKITPCMENGKIAIASGLINGLGCGTTEVFVFREQGASLAKYLFYYLVQKSFRRYAKSKFNGAVGHLRVPSSIFEEETFPLPPLAEQMRIVAHLDAAMQKLEASQERLEKLPVLLGKFRQAVLAAAVSGRLTKAWRAEKPPGESATELLNRIRAERRSQWEERQTSKMKGKQLSLDDRWKSKYEEPASPDMSSLPELPKGWSWTYGEVVADFVDPQPSHRTPPEYVGGVSYIGMGDVKADNQIDFKSARKVHPDVFEEHIARYELKLGDFFFGKIGTIGNPVRLPVPFDYTLSANVILVQPHTLMAEDYMFWYMSSNLIKEHFNKNSSATSQAAFGIQKARVIPIAVPSFEEQREIVRQVNHYFALADQLEARFEQASAMVEQLPQALLAKAFIGQLVPQTPDDEPASALLERLHATPVASIKGKPGRKAKAPAQAPLFD